MPEKWKQNQINQSQWELEKKLKQWRKSNEMELTEGIRSRNGRGDKEEEEREEKEGHICVMGACEVERIQNWDMGKKKKKVKGERREVGNGGEIGGKKEERVLNLVSTQQ